MWNLDSYQIIYLVQKDERRTSNIQRPTSNEKQTSTLGNFPVYGVRQLPIKLVQKAQERFSKLFFAPLRETFMVAVYPG